MKIYSWNVWCDNDPQKAFAFIQGLAYDVLCLQEVTPELHELLAALPVSMASGKEGVRAYADGTNDLNYSVILSRFPIIAHGMIALPRYVRPLRARMIDAVMRWSYANERQAIYADLSMEGKVLRIICAHLTLSTPSQRAKEFSALAEYRTDAPVFIVGDFNVLESWHILPFNWMRGAPLTHALPGFDERGPMEEQFAQAGFSNPLKGSVTHRISASQLDHILVPSDFTVEEAHVLKERHGSDHRPIYVSGSF